jgi:hypothetical protein
MSLPPSGQRRTCGHSARRQPRRTTQASQTSRSANQWARATCTPHDGVALVVPIVGYHAIVWSSPTARLDRPVKQVPSGATGRTGVMRNRTSSPGSRRARVGETATSCLGILSLRSWYSDTGPPPLFPRIAPVRRYPATTPDVGYSWDGEPDRGVCAAQRRGVLARRARGTRPAMRSQIPDGDFSDKCCGAVFEEASTTTRVWGSRYLALGCRANGGAR